MKTFGTHDPTPAARESFTLNYLDANETPQTFTGQVLVRSTGNDLGNVLEATRSQSADVVPILTRMLTKLMDDKDGLVNRRWAPTPKDPPSDLDADELAEWEPQYRGPDGNHYPLSDKDTLAKWQDTSTWTTRRRWIALMVDDEDAVVRIEDLMDIVEWVIGLSADRPTQPRA